MGTSTVSLNEDDGSTDKPSCHVLECTYQKPVSTELCLGLPVLVSTEETNGEGDWMKEDTFM